MIFNFKKNKNIHKKAEKFLFITGFTLGNPRLQTKDKELKTWVKMGGDFNYVKELQNNHEESYFKFITLLKIFLLNITIKNFYLKSIHLKNQRSILRNLKVTKC